MLAQLNRHCIEWKIFAHHNKKSRGQNYYHVVNKPDENNNIGLVYSVFG